MKKHTLLGTTLGAALIAAGSLAMAQQSGSGAGAPPSGLTNPPSGLTNPSSDLTNPSQGGSLTTAIVPPEEVVGMNVVNAQGEKIGEISDVWGDQVIVEVGGFLGIGARKVALDWDKITRSGTGDDMKLQTTLTKSELEAMPEYKR